MDNSELFCWKEAHRTCINKCNYLLSVFHITEVHNETLFKKVLKFVLEKDPDFVGLEACGILENVIENKKNKNGG